MDLFISEIPRQARAAPRHHRRLAGIGSPICYKHRSSNLLQTINPITKSQIQWMANLPQSKQSSLRTGRLIFPTLQHPSTPCISLRPTSAVSGPGRWTHRTRSRRYAAISDRARVQPSASPRSRTRIVSSANNPPIGEMNPTQLPRPRPRPSRPLRDARPAPRQADPALSRRSTHRHRPLWPL